MTYEECRANLIEGLLLQVQIGDWIKVAALAVDLRLLEAEQVAHLSAGSKHDT